MKFLVVQDWESTHGNHAGMVHMCDMLIERYPNDYIKIQKPCPPHMPIRNKITKRFMGWLDFKLYRKRWVNDYMNICKPMINQLKKGDEVFLLEYNWPSTSQLEIAKFIRTHFPGVNIYALSHLTPTFFKSIHAEHYILEWSQYVDKCLTLGSSLTHYFREIGIPQDKLSTGFHYVDDDYYHTEILEFNPIERPTIIAMGALQRDFQLLSEVVNSLPEVEWIICHGKKDVRSLFNLSTNIRLVGYVPEDELRMLMAQSDASLNIFEDTVGSNVITTSLAMGLCVIVSDVGSIRDYVDESCAILCNNTKESFVDAIRYLSIHPNQIIEKRKSSLAKTFNINIENVHHWFNSLKSV